MVNFKGKINSPTHKYEFRTNKWPKFPPQSCISVKRDLIEKYLKKLFQKKYHLTTLDFRIASLANANKKSTIFLNEKLTYYFQHVDNESNKNFKNLIIIGLKGDWRQSNITIMIINKNIIN